MKATIRVLLAPISNPKRDKRKNGLQGLAEYPAGRYVVDEGGGTVCRIGQPRWRDQLSVYDCRDGVEAIIAQSSEVEPHGICELLTTLDQRDGGHVLLGILLQDGKITVDDIKAAAAIADTDETIYDQV